MITKLSILLLITKLWAYVGIGFSKFSLFMFRQMIKYPKMFNFNKYFKIGDDKYLHILNAKLDNKNFTDEITLIISKLFESESCEGIKNSIDLKKVSKICKFTYLTIDYIINDSEHINDPDLEKIKKINILKTVKDGFIKFDKLKEEKTSILFDVLSFDDNPIVSFNEMIRKLVDEIPN